MSKPKSFLISSCPTAIEIPLWIESPYGEEECTEPLLTIEQSKGL